MLNSIKVTTRAMAICLLILTCSSSIALAKNEEVKLAFKISGKTDRIQIISKERVCTTPWKGKRVSSEVKSKKLVHRKSFKTGDNEITTKFKTTKMKLTINGKDAPSLEQLQESSVKTDMSGNKIDVPQESGESFIPDMSLILPDKPVRAGDTWTKTIKPSKGYPAPLTIQFKLNRIEDYKGSKCAIIQAHCLSDETFKDRFAMSHLSIRNRIYFDIERGKVVKNSSQTEFIITWLKQLKGLPMQRATFSTTAMALQIR